MKGDVNSLLKDLDQLPKRLIKAAAKAMYRQIMAGPEGTGIKQDSGQAAYNTYFAINSTSASEGFRPMKGRSPVGKRNDNRTDTGQHFLVARQKLVEFDRAIDAMPKVDSVLIYSALNPSGRRSGDLRTNYYERANVADAFAQATLIAKVKIYGEERGLGVSSI